MYPLNKSQANHYFTISVVLSKGHHHFGYAKLELLILLTLKVPMSTCGPPLKEVKLFIKQNKLSENPNELKEAIDRIKKTLYYLNDF
ncbi:hypothetical protein GCM10025854_26950 [Tetragenococcus muriaticus]|nr:hypothetical protein GCM10025854_03900 [Tetragenococcus muriaticus]GMA48445.1 hypothetical protein GCM10025854_26950 [Tetragenococcus muriaticus]